MPRSRLGKAAATRGFLAALEEAGITLPPGHAEMIVRDYLELHRQLLLIRAACPPAAPLPLGLTGNPADGGS